VLPGAASLEAAEEALDKVTTPIDGAIEQVRNCPGCSRWNSGLDATAPAFLKVLFRAITYVGLSGYSEKDMLRLRSSQFEPQPTWALRHLIGPTGDMVLLKPLAV
jgi:hypothetical protein